MLCIVGERERRRNPRLVIYMFSSAEGVLALPAMIGLHATLYPELDVGTGAFPSLRHSQRQHAIYGEPYLSLDAVRSRVSKLSEAKLVQFYVRAFGELVLVATKNRATIYR